VLVLHCNQTNKQTNQHPTHITMKLQ